MAKGNPNPSPETRFKPGQSGNPGGKTSAHVEAERKSAEIAAFLREKMLSSMQEKVNSGEDVLDLMDANALKLFKDSEDRAYGTPKSTAEIGGLDGGAVLTEVRHVVVDPPNREE